MPLGIPYSRFLSWSDMDRGYALAWTANKAATCPQCGTRADEWAADEDAYIATHTTCEGCARLGQERDGNLDRTSGGDVLPGQHPYLIRRELYEQQQNDRPPAAPAPPDRDDE